MMNSPRSADLGPIRRQHSGEPTRSQLAFSERHYRARLAPIRTFLPTSDDFVFLCVRSDHTDQEEEVDDEVQRLSFNFATDV